LQLFGFAVRFGHVYHGRFPRLSRFHRPRRIAAGSAAGPHGPPSRISGTVLSGATGPALVWALIHVLLRHPISPLDCSLELAGRPRHSLSLTAGPACPHVRPRSS